MCKVSSYTLQVTSKSQVTVERIKQVKSSHCYKMLHNAPLKDCCHEKLSLFSASKSIVSKQNTMEVYKIKRICKIKLKKYII